MSDLLLISWINASLKFSILKVFVKHFDPVCLFCVCDTCVHSYKFETIVVEHEVDKHHCGHAEWGWERFALSATKYLWVIRALTKTKMQHAEKEMSCDDDHVTCCYISVQGPVFIYLVFNQMKNNKTSKTSKNCSFHSNNFILRILFLNM